MILNVTVPRYGKILVVATIKLRMDKVYVTRIKTATS